MTDKSQTPSMTEILADLVEFLHVKPRPISRHSIEEVRESLGGTPLSGFGQSFGNPSQEKEN